MAANQYTGTTQPRKRKFLDAMVSAAGNISEACRVAGVTRKTHYTWLRDDPEYVEAYADAREAGIEVLEDEARRRAYGWDETVTKGDTETTVRKHSDALMMFLLKAARPDVYRERYEVLTIDQLAADIARLEREIGSTPVPG